MLKTYPKLCRDRDCTPLQSYNQRFLYHHRR
ncbi:MAG: hypothetical protein E3J90_04375 [Promethearchaeota archaeon]|nr:MAG: hypothetical protein E3J90_04375 [Candidatus Lokiarchaeota archaeon]